jgi:uncharacterized protein (DUF433 family)
MVQANLLLGVRWQVMARSAMMEKLSEKRFSSMIAPAIDIATLVVKSPETLGGRPRITGTRLSVQRVAAWYKMGLNAEEIHDRTGTVSLAQIYAALTYYHSNVAEIEGYLAEEKAAYERLSATMGQSA